MTVLSLPRSGRRLSARGSLAMAVMAAGMLDTMAFGGRLLTAPAWVAVYLLLALAVAVPRRGARCTPMAVHRALQLIVMAGITALSGTGAAGARAAGHPMAAMAAMPGMGLAVVPVVVAAAAVFCGYSGWALVVAPHRDEAARTPRAVVLQRLELLAGAVSVVAMAGMLAL